MVISVSEDQIYPLIKLAACRYIMRYAASVQIYVPHYRNHTHISHRKSTFLLVYSLLFIKTPKNTHWKKTFPPMCIATDLYILLCTSFRILQASSAENFYCRLSLLPAFSASQDQIDSQYNSCRQYQ